MIILHYYTYFCVQYCASKGKSKNIYQTADEGSFQLILTLTNFDVIVTVKC